MNILVTAAQGLYEDLSASFVHNELKEYVKAGHKVRAIVPVAYGKKTKELSRLTWPIVRTEHDGVEIFYIRCLSLSERGQHGFNPMAAEAAVRLHKNALLRGFTPDVIHAHAILFGGRLGAFFKKVCSVPLVITTHGGDTDVSLTQEQNARARRICDAADRIAAVSPAYEKKTRQIGTKTPISCILNGFNLSLAADGVKPPHSLIQVSSMIVRKHMDLTIKAAAELKKLYPDLTLTLVGKGVERSRLEKLCSELCMLDYVNFLGFLSNGEAMKKMAENKIFLMPSTEEGFGIVYAEAMACGCVTIGTQGEGIDGFIQDGVNGYLVKPNDVDDIIKTVRRCFDEPEKAAAVAGKGKEDVRSLTWQENARKYLELFECLTGTDDQ